MNPNLALIFSRRSIRRYQAREVSDKFVRDMLEAGMAAPSAVCKDPWHFIVVKDRRSLEAIASGLPNGRMLAGAGVGIVVCGDPRQAHDGQLSYLLQDCSAAAENILLAASALGLGACWLGIHPREERIALVREALGVPEPILPVAVLAVGWPAESPEPRTRFSELRVHREKW
jgi:nitroreductase